MKTLGQFREFIKNLPDDYELRIESFFEPEITMASACFNYISIEEERAVIIMPEVVHISDSEDMLTVSRINNKYD